jgi:hypothetical protein
VTILTRLAAATFVLSLGAPSTSGQLHLITGSADSKSPEGYTSALFRVTDRGVEKVEDLVTDRGGTDWIATSQELRKAVLVPEETAPPVVVVDFAKGAAVKKCRKPDLELAPIRQWLWDTPDRGPVYAEFLGAQVRAMSLDPSVPCERSFAPVTASDARYVTAAGNAAVAAAVSSDYMRVLLRKDGTLSRYFGPGMGEEYFDERVPGTLFDDIAHPIAFVLISNARLFALAIIEDGRPAFGHRLLIFRRSDKTWHRMPALSDDVSYERAFGSFITAAAAIRKGSTTEKSAGRAEWRAQPSAAGPSAVALFLNSPFVFPGRLYLYDAETERVRTIATNQADSEILLVEGGVVYYRASDRLYSATITDKGLSPGRLLATSDVIRDAHWAFIKH